MITKIFWHQKIAKMSLDTPPWNLEKYDLRGGYLEAVFFFSPVYRMILSCFEFQCEIPILSWKMNEIWNQIWEICPLIKFKFWLDFRGHFEIFCRIAKKKKTYSLHFENAFMCIQLILVLFSNGLDCDKKNAGFAS